MKKIFNNLPIIVCCLALCIMLIMTVYFVFSFDSPSKTEIAVSRTISFEDEWIFDDGSEVTELSNLNILSDDTFNTERSISAVLPDNISKGSAICLNINHLYITVQIDGVNVYSHNSPESRLYTNSIGSDWVFIPLDLTDSGKTIEIYFRTCYKDSPCGINNISISAGHGMVLRLIEENGGNLIFSIIFLVLAMLLIFGDLIIGVRFNKKHSFMYLGLITLTVAMYTLAETHIFQLFTTNNRIIHFLSCFSLFMLPMPIILYTSSAFTFRFKNTANIFSIVYFVVLIAVIAMNYFDIADYHDLLFVAHILSIFAVSAMTSAIIRHVYTSVKSKEYNLKHIILEPLGIGLLVITGLIDVCRYYFFHTNDPAKFLRIGLLGFVFFFAISNCQKYITTLALNDRAEFISQLAYHDGLTGLLNRTAYNEKLEELSNLGNKVGICAFDVNDLKKINDNMGHDFGDRLIQESSKILSKAFESNGVCYRIGGDEFMAIVQGNDPEKNILSAMARLTELINKHNESGINPFRISIATGYSIYNSSDNLTEVIRSADMMMYENKRKMKAEMNK